MVEYLLQCKFPLKAEQYDKLEETNIDYRLDEEGLVFDSEKDREIATSLLNNK